MNKIIKTQYGEIEAVYQDGCLVFKGVPYAKPPVGELRFRKPQAPEPWEGVRKADTYSCKSMQGPARPGFYKKEFYSNPDFETQPSEDCLYLNIWIPEKADTEKLPVGIYVHGGAFMSGAGSNLPFVCSNLAKAGVIVVTINYRLGLLGFLSHPILGIEGENEGGGNFALWDQLAAISFIKENISAFGGDPDNITVFGQSAGAMSLQALAVTRQAQGLFKNMILQSGGGYENPLAAYFSKETAYEVADEVLEALGVAKDSWKESDAARKAALDRLYNASCDELMEAAGEVIGKSFQVGRGLPFQPSVDGELITDNGNKLMEEGKFLQVNYILGSNANDITTEGQEVVSPETNKMHQANITFADMVNKSGKSNAYVYYFTRKLPGDDSGAFHSAELWYVFGSLDYCWRPLTDDDKKLSDAIIGAWSSFMKSGEPLVEGADSWKTFTQENPYVQEFDV